MNIGSLGALDSMMRMEQISRRSEGPLEVKAKQGPLDRAVQTDPSSTREAGEDGYITDVRQLASAFCV